MNITIKIIRNIAVSNLVILGLVACSSSPAPWTQVDDSPWGEKRKAEAESLSVDAESLSDPVLLGEAESTASNAMTEVEMMPEVAAETHTEVITPVVASTVVETAIVAPQSTEQELLGLPASDYAVQVYAAKSIESVEKFKNAKAVYELKTVATNRSGSIMYVLVDIYSDRASANAAATDLASRTGAKPWIRSLAGLQKIIVQ